MKSNSPENRWNAITPERLLILLFVVELLLFLFEQYYPKGWAAIIATACVFATTVYVFLGYGLAIISYRPFQFSIRSLLIFTTILAFLCGWMVSNLQQAASQKKAFEDWSASEGATPGWLRAIFGDDFFRDINDYDAVEISDKSNATDADLKCLRKANKLKALYLRSDKITDAGLVHLKELKGLNTLEIDNAAITDAGLKHLAGLDNLRDLSLSNTRITGAGLKNIKLNQIRFFTFAETNLIEDDFKILSEFKQLEEICLRSSGITDEGLKFLKEIHYLRSLDLSHNRITDSGMEQIKDLPKLERLFLTDTQISDAALKYLKELKHLRLLNLIQLYITDNGLKTLSEFETLQHLELSGDQITDAGLKHLEKLRSLEYLKLIGYGVKDAAIAKLQKELPNCKIDH